MGNLLQNLIASKGSLILFADFKDNFSSSFVMCINVNFAQQGETYKK